VAIKNHGDEGFMTCFRKGLVGCLILGLLLSACVPAIKLPTNLPIKLPFALPGATISSCQPIPVGIVIGAEDVADAQDQQAGYELAASEINQAGGVQGCSIRLVYNRSEGQGTNPDAVQAAMLELADGGEVAVLGATNSAATKRIAAISQYIKMPVVITPDTPDDLMSNGSSWIFRINPASKSYAAASASLIKEKVSATANVAILYDKSEFGESAASIAGNAVINAGLSLVGYVGYDPAVTDFTGILSQVRNTVPNVLYVIASDAKQAQSILAGISSLKIKLSLVIGNGSGFTSHEFLYDASGKLNSSVAGLALAAPWSADLKDRSVTDFAQRLASYRKASSDNAPYPPTLATVQAYTALHLLADAMNATAKASPRDWKTILTNPDQLAAYRTELAQTLRGFKAAEHNTLLGPVEFDADGQNQGQAVIVQALSGSLLTVYPTAVATHALVLSGR
jgi:branched-chain amino acid transport system substrate-binding protein